MEKELPGYNIELVKKKLRELQEKYEKEIKPKEKDYNEENTKKGFIEPLLRVLNWNTEDINEVDAEFYIKNKRSSGSADYALKIGGEVKILLEAKAFDKDLETGYDIVHGMRRTYVEQLINYAFDLNKHMNTKIDYCILTNGKEWRVYYVHYQGVSFDRKLVFVLKIEEFLDKFIRFWSLEKGNFAKGDLDKFLKDDERLKIDKKAVNSLLYCKKLLVDSVIKDYNDNTRDMRYVIDKLINKPILDAPETFPKFYEMQEEEKFNKFILEATSNVINKILFIRIIEDKGYLVPKLTKQKVREWKEWFSSADRILRLFREACNEAEDRYNGGIFRINPYDILPYNDETLEKVIEILGDFNFEEIDADVIGRIYEIYLGTVLSVEEEIRGKKRTKLSSDFTERKKLGQYYTPKFVVDYIVKNTLGKLLEGKTPEEVSKIKVLDPACGSGSFLIRSFDYLKDYYVRYNDKQMEKAKKGNINDINNWANNHQIIDYNHKILKENLHGVDLNYLSTQICSINLWLRALEKDKKLEKLSKNMLHGNSLISGVEDKEELIKYKDELKEIAKLRDKIKDYYGKELSKREKDELEDMEVKLKEFKDKVNTPLNKNLKKYFENLDLAYPFNWEVEFTEVFDPDTSKEEQGFDVVIGNPPYVRVQRFSNIEKEFLKDHFISASKKFDLYILFIEKALKLLKLGGYFSFIIPNKFTQTIYGESIKKYILDNFQIITFIDFGDLKVFEDVTTYPSIIIIKKQQPRDNYLSNYIKVKELFDGLNVLFDKNIGKEFYDDDKITVFKFNQKNLTPKHWIFMPDIEQKLYEKIKNQEEITLKDLRERIYEGFISGKNDAFFIDDVKSSQLKLEKDLLMPVPKGNKVRRFNIEWDKEFVIFPHKQKGESVISIDLKDYPNIKKYLESKKSELEKRKYVIEAGKKWYEIWNTRDLRWFNQDKIITPNLAASNNFAYDFSNNKSTKYFFIDHDCYGIILKNKNREDYVYLTGLLNSKLIEFYFKKISPMFSGGYYKYHTQYLENLPIKIMKNKKIFNNKVIQITDLKKNLIEILYSFSNVLNNQAISDEKACKFEHYWKNSELYDFSKKTLAFANKTEAKISKMNIKEEGDKLTIYTANISLVQNKEFKNIKTIELTIKDDILRKFLYYSFKKYISEKKGRGFGSGIILDVIKKIPIPVYAVNIKMNLDKIKQVMKDFEHETKDLLEINNKIYKNLTEIEDDIEKTDKEIDDMVYDLYNITKEERKIIEESLK